MSRFEQNVDASAFYDGDGDGDVYPENEYLAPADGAFQVFTNKRAPLFSAHSIQYCLLLCSQEAALGS